MLYNEKVDIIIPAYNVPDNILFRVLSSIVCQDKIENIEVTIVDDASTEQNYQEVINKFLPLMKINLLRYEINGGPGVARQYGLDHTQNEFVTFIDADDVFSGHFAISTLKGMLIENKEATMAMGRWGEIVYRNNNSIIMPIDFNFVWLFGKMYRRDLIELYNIRFHPISRSNEDVGFNSIYTLLTGGEELVITTEDVVYYWLENKNSITRENNCSYSYRSDKTGSFYGFVTNKIYAIEKYKEHYGHTQKVYEEIFSVLCFLYTYWLECFNHSEQIANENFNWCIHFFNKCYCVEVDNLSEAIKVKIYGDAMSGKFLTNSFNHIPKIDFFSFLNKLKESDKRWEDMIK